MSGVHERHSRIALIGAGLQSTGSAIARGFPVSIAYADDFERQQISTATVNNSMTVGPQGNRRERRARRARSRRK